MLQALHAVTVPRGEANIPRLLLEGYHVQENPLEGTVSYWKPRKAATQRPADAQPGEQKPYVFPSGEAPTAPAQSARSQPNSASPAAANTAGTEAHVSGTPAATAPVAPAQPAQNGSEQATAAGSGGYRRPQTRQEAAQHLSQLVVDIAAAQQQIVETRAAASAMASYYAQIGMPDDAASVQEWGTERVENLEVKLQQWQCEQTIYEQTLADGPQGSAQGPPPPPPPTRVRPAGGPWPKTYAALEQAIADGQVQIANLRAARSDDAPPGDRERELLARLDAYRQQLAMLEAEASTVPGRKENV